MVNKINKNQARIINKNDKKLLLFILNIMFFCIFMFVSCKKTLPDTDYTNNQKLFSIVKEKIKKTIIDDNLILDTKDLNYEKNENIIEHLEPYQNQTISKQQNIEIERDNQVISRIENYITENKIKILNENLKTIPQLENSNNIISLSNLKAKLNYNIIEMFKNIIINNKNYFSNPASNRFNYYLQLDLNFTINIANREENIIHNDRNVFITNNKSEVLSKIAGLADSIEEKLSNQTLDGAKIINSKASLLIEEKFANQLVKKIKEKNIKIKKFSEPIKAKQFEFELTTNWSNDSSIDFIKYINSISNSATIIEHLFDRDKGKPEHYQFNKNDTNNDQYITHSNQNFKIIDWSIAGIQLPERTITKINIFHNKNEVIAAFSKFLPILKAYCKAMISNASDKVITIKNKIADNVEEFTKVLPLIRLHQWCTAISNPFSKEDKRDLIASSVVGESYGDKIQDKGIKINNVTLELSFKQLNISLAKKEKFINFYYK